MRPGERLEDLSREQLLELLAIYSKNWLAMDGVWFQSVERKYGMEEAMFHDVEAWKRFTVTEGRRIKKFLGLPERPGLEGLERALEFRFYANLSRYELRREGEQPALPGAGVPGAAGQDQEAHGPAPLQARGAGEEYAGFARTIDDRISCQCVSCCPEVTQEDCACAWRFTLETQRSTVGPGPGFFFCARSYFPVPGHTLGRTDSQHKGA